ncbi:MAG: hypothetical protein EKK64_07565 [Neisseriaceae bacterium]|nr:MAG: hypothetical protein EKK64_07565 [Neisseriaceae bacterium]
MNWNEYSKLAVWVLVKRLKIKNPDEYISECYLAFVEALKGYKPELSNFATYYRNYLEGYMKDYLTYNESLIHIPRLKRESHSIAVSSLSQPLSDDGTGVCAQDLLEDSGEAYNAEEKEQAKWLSRIDDLYPRLTKAEQRVIPYFKAAITEDAEVPRQYRTHIWSIRQKLLDFCE